MDSLTFIAELLKIMAWPVVVLVGLCLFRRELKALVVRIRKGKVGAAEFEFGPSPSRADPHETPDLERMVWGVGMPTDMASAVAPRVDKQYR